MNMFEIMSSGGVVMYPLLLLSIVSVAVIFERFLFWFFLGHSRDLGLVNKILKFVEEGEPETAASFGVGTKDFVAKTLLNGLRHHFYSLNLALETQALIELRKMRKNLIILDTIITAAPLLGILGTVLGIIASFNVLGSDGIADPKAVSGGISQALITTAFGLSVALITIFPFNFFNAKYEEAREELERSASTLELLMDRNLKRKNSQVNEVFDRHEILGEDR